LDIRNVPAIKSAGLIVVCNQLICGKAAVLHELSGLFGHFRANSICRKLTQAIECIDGTANKCGSHFSSTTVSFGLVAKYYKRIANFPRHSFSDLNSLFSAQNFFKPLLLDAEKNGFIRVNFKGFIDIRIKHCYAPFTLRVFFIFGGISY